MQTRQGCIAKLDKLKDASYLVDRFERGNKAIAVMYQLLNHRYGRLVRAAYLYWLILTGRNGH